MIDNFLRDKNIYLLYILQRLIFQQLNNDVPSLTLK